jgi:transposase
MPFCGLEISQRVLGVCLKIDKSYEHFEVTNTGAGHRDLIKLLRRRGPVRVCMEATGDYGFDAAAALSGCDEIELMVANPRDVRRFAEALGRRGKTDRIDAEVLCEFAERMPFRRYQPPPASALALRSVTRRIQALTEQCAREKNRLHAASLSAYRPPCVRASLKRLIGALERESRKLLEQAERIIHQDPWLKKRYRLMRTVPGLGPKTTPLLLGELAVLDPKLEPRQWVAHAGLDPAPAESGTSLRKPRRISKKGNRILRAGLYMPALVAVRHDPHLKAFYQRLQNRGCVKLQALTAAMRKLLHAIWGIWHHQRPFDAKLLFPNIEVPIEA